VQTPGGASPAAANGAPSATDTAPSRPVHHSDAPAVATRATTSSCGMPKRPRHGAETTTTRGDTASSHAAPDAERLP